MCKGSAAGNVVEDGEVGGGVDIEVGCETFGGGGVRQAGLVVQEPGEVVVSGRQHDASEGGGRVEGHHVGGKEIVRHGAGACATHREGKVGEGDRCAERHGTAAHVDNSVQVVGAAQAQQVVAEMKAVGTREPMLDNQGEGAEVEGGG